MGTDKNSLLPAKNLVMVERVANCIQCGAALPRSRSDRRFCSRICAMRFTKWRHALQRKEKHIKRLLAEIAEYGNYPQFVDAEASITNVFRSVDYWAKVTSTRQRAALNALDADK